MGGELSANWKCYAHGERRRWRISESESESERQEWRGLFREFGSCFGKLHFFKKGVAFSLQLF